MVYNGNNAKEIVEWSGGRIMTNTVLYCGSNFNGVAARSDLMLVVDPTGKKIINIGDTIIMPTFKNHLKYKCGFRWIILRK